MTTHDAAVTPTGLLPDQLIDSISYMADDESISQDVIDWLPRIRYVFHKTTKTIFIAGCQVRNVDPSRYFKQARTWTKRVEFYDNEKEKNPQLGADAAILIILLKWIGHDQSLSLKNQSLARKPPVPVLITESIRDIKLLLRFGILSPEVFIDRVRPRYPDSYGKLDPTTRALMQVQANGRIRRLAYGTDSAPARRFPGASGESDTPMKNPLPPAEKQRTARGALKRFLAEHPTPQEMDTPEWKAARSDEQRGAFLLKIANGLGIPTTMGSVVNGVRELRKAADRAHAAAALVDSANAEARARAAALTTVATHGPQGLPFDPARAVALAKTIEVQEPPPRPAPTEPGTPPPALASAHTAIQQGFEALRLAREHHKAMGDQLDLMEMALQDAQRYAGSDLIVDMQKGMQDALQEAMITKFGQFLPWGPKS